MDERGPELGFAEVDRALDRALSLEGEARATYLLTLSVPLRERVVRLLEHAEGDALAALSSEASGTVAQLATPDKAGHWVLQRELGAGGMGQVFYAERQELGADENFKQRAAVKLLWTHQTEPENHERFLRERRILADLDHPGLARFLDGGFLEDGRPWFAMEYIEGEALLTFVAGLDVDERLALFLQVCDAVAFAHARLIVHRDIKPQNILVDSNGRTRLLDFGVAGLLHEIGEGDLTRTQGSPLTLQYASPEQVTGSNVAVPSDIYQLGLLLFEMITLARPYDTSKLALQAAIETICVKAPLQPATLTSDVHDDLNAVVLKALAKEPDRRYASVADLARDVQAFREGKPVQAVAPTRWYLARRYLARNRTAVGFSVAMFVVLFSATLIAMQLAREAREEAHRTALAQEILEDVFQKAEPFGEGGADITLAEALVRAQPDIAESIAGDPYLAYEVNQSLAQIYANLGLVEFEVLAYEAVIAAANQMDGDHHDKALLGVAGVGSALARTDPAKAIGYFDRHLKAFPTEAEAANWLSAQYALTGALNRMRRYEQAAVATVAMGKVVEQYGVTNPQTLGRLSQMRAGVARRTGDTSAEDIHWRDAVRHMRAADNASALAVTLNNRAIFLGRQSRYAESEDAFLEAIAIYETAEHTDPSYAGVLRSYAGLLFRTDKHEEAILTTRQALELLDADTQGYARLIAERNLVNYQVVIGDVESAANSMFAALDGVIENFAPGTDARNRLKPLFAKLLIFADQNDAAYRVLGVTACANTVDAVLDGLEARSESEYRQQLWALAAQVQQEAEQGALSRESWFAAWRYADQAPAFFDVADRWRLVSLLDTPAASVWWPKTFEEERQHLLAMKTDAQSVFEANGDRVTRYVEALESGSQDICPK